MNTALSDICRQLRLAYIVETKNEWNNSNPTELIESILSADLEGRRRAKLGKSEQA
ncbi:hypothetical protein [Zhaonella formicivorans]|uniref:hypothetical protein n=1 Tax=Zhaonella formicivorans TaxID=2528593 RepID=UPI001D11E6F5|nr:hypothetical protein [Zhaonella formicivorans]